MKYKYIISLFIFIFSLNCFSQPKCYIEHYGVKDGLPQHSIMDMLQDEKGFMWFSTWDGLCKFDGYQFKTYQIEQNSMYSMRNSRIDHILADKEGYIWTLSYGKEIHRFDPRTEKFVGLNSIAGHEDELPFFASKMLLTPSGKVWLLSKDKGCIKIKNDDFNLEIYNHKNTKIGSDKVNSIFEDGNGNSWILTECGLNQIDSKGNILTTNATQNAEIAKTSFYSACEINNEIWFGANSGKIWIYNKVNNKFRLFGTSLNSNIIEIKNIADNQLLISTNSSLFFIYDNKNDLLQQYNLNKGIFGEDNNIRSSHIDSKKNIWFEQNKLGVARFDFETKTINHFTVAPESPIVNVTAPLFFIVEDKQNRVWVHPRGGGFSYYDAANKKLLPFYNEPNSPNWKFSGMLHSIHIDKQGVMWLSTHSNGLEKVTFSDDIFRSYQPDPNIYSPMNNLVRCIFEDDERNLWVSTKNGKIQVYDAFHNKLGYLCENGTIGNGKPIDGLTYCMMQDDKNNIWIGTKGKGIYRLKKKAGYQMHEISHFKHDPDNTTSLSSDNVYSIFQDKKKRIWIGTYGGGLNLMDSEREGLFYNINNELKNYPNNFGSQIRIICDDKFGNICVGTTLGLILFSSDFTATNNIEYKFFTRQSKQQTSLTANDIFDIQTTSKGETYLATFGGGINRIAEVDAKGFPTKFESLTTKDGLSSNISLQIAEDHEGMLWISSEGNISKYDPQNKNFKTYSEIYRLTKGEAFTEGAKCVTRTGIIYFGYIKGMIGINPNIIKDNQYKPYIALTHFQIENKDVNVGDNSPLHKSIDEMEELTLNHKQNFFNIEFAAIDFTDNKQIKYAYKLDGFDENWITAHDQRVATYNNLSPGEYTFRVKSTNSDGVWIDNEHILPITIVPSFWQTKWAILLYAFIAMGILFAVFRSLFVYYRLKDKMVLEQEQIEMKTRFFMDISHEIRTPLTMVVSPIENIIEGDYSPSETKSQLRLVLKNANRMLRMVNQILDFRKIQKMKLNVELTSIGEFVEEICQNFSKNAEMQGIQMNTNNQLTDEKIWIDRDSFEKLLFNLLSNALKYTPSGKKIRVNLYKKSNAIAVEVEDEGKGMNREVQNKLFTRFASFSEDKSKPSTGIGLSIVKEVADKHNAKIHVESKENAGSKFTIHFPLGREHFKNEEVEFVYNKTQEESHPQLSNIEMEIEKPETTSTKEADNQKDTLLVVEDDPDLRAFIKDMLSAHYTILDAENGRLGFEIAKAELPDFILSDIMMPETDGVELLQLIRENSETSHIPMILLTAKSDIESRLEALKYGADDYITKPFSVKYLKARIENIMMQRKRLYATFIGTIPKGKKEEPAKAEHCITAQDEQFIERAKNIVEENIDNSEFMIEDLVANMLMSRTVFFKKLKSLTGLAPVEFMREVKIKYAARMLINSELTVKEISFMIGIADTKYFSKWFKTIMGMTPSEYREANKKE